MYLKPKFIKNVKCNTEGRDFIVGDLHGCYDELMRLLTHVNFNPKSDRIFSTGDLVDRGPKSLECLSLLAKPWFHAVLGNHEDVLLTKIKEVNNINKDFISKFKNDDSGMTKDEASYVKSLEPYAEAIFKMPLAIAVDHMLLGKFYIVHAEILPEHMFVNKEINYQSEEYLTYLDKMQKEDFSEELKNFFEISKNININTSQNHNINSGDNNIDSENENYTINEDIYNSIDYTLKQKLIWSRKIVSHFYEINKNAILDSNFSFLKKEEIPTAIKVFCGHNIVPFPMKIGQQYYLDTGAALGYSEKTKSYNIFTQFGHEFFGLSMLDAGTGIVYNCITSEKYRGKIVKMEMPLYST